MSSRQGASQNRTAPENRPIETCHQLLENRKFNDVRFIVDMNQRVSSKRHDEFEKARAICDVLIAAEKRLSTGLVDYYGMLRVTPPGPVLLEDFKKLMKLLDGKHNRFPHSQEAAEKALQAWSMLSKPQVKALYDLALSKCVGSSQTGGGFLGKCKGKMDSEFWKVFLAMNVNPIQSGLRNSFIPKKHNVRPRTDDVVVVISDDDEDDDDGQENMTMARAAKLCKVNGKRVKSVPSKKKQNKRTTVKSPL